MISDDRLVARIDDDRTSPGTRRGVSAGARLPPTSSMPAPAPATRMKSRRASVLERCSVPGSFDDVGEGGLVGDSFDMIRVAKMGRRGKIGVQRGRNQTSSRGSAGWGRSPNGAREVLLWRCDLAQPVCGGRR